MLSKLACALPVGLLLASAANAQIVINEFMYDHSGVDLDEFIEFYNASGSPVDMTGWTIDGQGTTTSNYDFVIPPTPPVPPGGFLVAANAVAVAPALQAAGVIVTGAPSGGWLQNGGRDSIMLRDAGGVVVDAVSYEMNGSTSPLVDPEQVEGFGIPGALANFGYSAGSLNYNSFQRLTDGYDTNDNGRDFRIALATPGASNNIAFDVAASGYVLDAEIAGGGLTVGAALPMIGASSAGPEPELTDYTTTGLPALPVDADGLLARMGSESASDSIGASRWLETAPLSSATVECFVYIDTTLTAAATGEYWHIGLQGGSAEFFNVPASIFPSQPFGSDMTGVGLSYVVDDVRATCYLMDYSNGSTETVLGSYDVPSTGWYRVRVSASQGYVEARIGGDQFVDNGVVLGGATAADGAFGGVTFGYRKSGTGGMGIGRAVSPMYMDSLFIQGSSSELECFGAPTANTLGDPQIGVTGLPYLGNSGFGYSFSGLLPNATYNVLLGTGFAGDIGIDVSSVLVGAVPAGLTLWVNLNILGAPATSDASGNGTFPVPLSGGAQLIGLELFGQGFQLDGGLGVPIPFSATKAVKFTIGNF